MLSPILENLTDQEILGLTIIGEGRGEPIEGQVGIGCVIRNRLHNSSKRSYSEICLSKDQFSCWNENDPNYLFLLGLANKLLARTPLTDPHILQCLWVANGIASWQIVDNTGGSENYLTKSLFNSDQKPKWALKAKNLTFMGNQVFFDV